MLPNCDKSAAGIRIVTYPPGRVFGAWTCPDACPATQDQNSIIWTPALTFDLLEPFA